MNTDGRTSNEFFSDGLSPQKKHARRLRVLITLSVIAVLLIAELLRSNIYISVEEFTYLSSELPRSFDGTRIVQISDFHSSGFSVDRIAEKTAEQKPDLIFVTGDTVDESVESLDAPKKLIEELSKIADTYVIWGNHDQAVSSDKLKELAESFKKSGAILLDNDYTYLERGGSRVLLVGTSDSPDDYYNEPLMARLPKSERFVLWMHHYPEDFKAIISASEKEKSPVDLVFAGHAHGGLIGLPFVGGLYAPGQGLFPKYVSGRYNEGNASMLVSRGLGNAGHTKRLFNSLHIIVCELKSGEKER